MTCDQFSVMMTYIIADLVAMIVEKDNVSPAEAIRNLYSSKLYEYLENEDTKVWHYSTPMLYSLYQQEKNIGKITFPDV